MRMWMIDPKLLCNKHLLGEHGEIHKFKKSFEKRYSVKGRLSPVIQIEPQNMKSRHDELAKELKNRKMNHKSDYEQPNVDYIEGINNIVVDRNISLRDLSERCQECKDKIGDILI